MADFLSPYFISLDLEMNQPSGRIIQVGAVIGDIRTGEEMSRFDVLVNPNEPLSDEIAKLCSFTPAQIESAGSLQDAYLQLLSWIKTFSDGVGHSEKHPLVQLSPLTWGGGDTETLRSQVEKPVLNWPFGRRWLDVKTVFTAYQNARGLNCRSGLSKSMTQLGLRFEGLAHRADDDAWNTFRLYHALLSKFIPKT